MRLPLFVLARDTNNEVCRYDSLADMQHALEPIDVENDEFLAWDADGYPLRLAVRPARAWLEVAPSGAPAEAARVVELLLQYAEQHGLDVDAALLRSATLVDAYAPISAHRPPDEGGWWRWLWRRKRAR